MNRYTIETERISTVWYEVEAESEEEAYYIWSNYDGDTADIWELDSDIVMENYGSCKLDQEDIL